MKNVTTLFVKKLVATLFWLMILLPMTFAAYLKNVPQTLVQPNGDTVHCFATGDEFYHRLHDANGYTIILDKSTGYYVYADKVSDMLVPTSYIAGRTDPAEAGLTPNLSISAAQWLARRQQWEATIPAPTLTRAGERNHGHINNLVVFIRFADDDPFENEFSDVEAMFNSSTPGYSSLYNYFKAATYDQLTITSTFYPTQSDTTILSYQDEYNRNYFQPWSIENPEGYNEEDDSSRMTREHQLLKRAVDAIADLVPADLNVDYDGDGYVDNVCFVVRGNVGEWNNLLWPHRWSLYSESAYINGKRVNNFNFQLADAVSYFNTSVLCHEMNHTLGAPDLYHYNEGREMSVVDVWDLMHQNTNPPQHMGAYMKYKYGNWISDIPEISECGTYSLHSLGSSATNNCYKIASQNPNEFFVLEYRNTDDLFEGTLPSSGLLVYRINTDFRGNSSWNGVDVFDEVYIFRPGGAPDNNGDIWSAAFAADFERTEMNENTSPYPFLTDSTVVGVGDFFIQNISETNGEVMTFTLCQSVSPIHVPTVTTDNVTDITSSSATCGGNVTYDGGAEVTARGICWSTEPNPTIDDSLTTVGNGFGCFTSNITDLTLNKIYYVRAYATNSVGTGYGEEMVFSPFYPCPDHKTVTDIDGNTYNTVQIGRQCWMKENLRTTKYADNTYISQGRFISSNTAYWYYPDNNSSINPIYGLLYNWTAVMGSASSSSDNPSGVQGICPTGWHVPSDAEWMQLINYVSSQSEYMCGNDNTSIAKALASASGWSSSSNACAIGDTPSTNNATGFYSLPAGYFNMSYRNFGEAAFFWSATQSASNSAYYRQLSYNNATMVSSNGRKYLGLPVRCVCDDVYEDVVTVPAVTTTPVTTIATTTATSGGNVTDDGGAEVTTRGVCWSTTQAPTLSDSHTTDSTGTGNFTSSLTDLTPNTTYYLRAYATKIEGTSYGNEETFTTIPCDTTGIHTTDNGIFTLYPNPTTGIVTIELTPETCTLKPEIQVFDVYGRMLVVMEMQCIASPQIVEIDLSRYATGVYLLKVVDRGKVMAVGKVVKE